MSGYRSLQNGISNCQNQNIQGNETIREPNILKSDTFNMLEPNQELVYGSFKLIYQSDGNLVLYVNRNSSGLYPLWASNTVQYSPGYCLLQPDGNFVLFNKQGKSYWSTQTGNNPSSDGPFTLILQGDRNLVLYNSKNKALWATMTMINCDVSPFTECISSSRGYATVQNTIYDNVPVANRDACKTLCQNNQSCLSFYHTGNNTCYGFKERYEYNGGTTWRNIADPNGTTANK